MMLTKTQPHLMRVGAPPVIAMASRRTGVKRLVIVIGACLLAGVGIAAAWMALKPTTVRYVRSSELVYGYAGMQEARDAYQAKKQRWQGELDSLQADYRTAVDAYKAEYEGLSQRAREEHEGILGKQEESLREYGSTLTGRAREEEEKMTQGVLNQINGIVQEYGREHGIDVILGTTQSGNLLYGADDLDITADVLAVLNSSYKGGRSHAVQ